MCVCVCVCVCVCMSYDSLSLSLPALAVQGPCGDPKDCCEFFEEVCVAQSCKGYCGGPGSQGFQCFCDSVCTQFNE